MTLRTTPYTMVFTAAGLFIAPSRCLLGGNMNQLCIVRSRLTRGAANFEGRGSASSITQASVIFVTRRLRT